MQIVAEITPSETGPGDRVVPQCTVQVARTISEVEALRPLWTGLQWHPNSDVDFYLHVVRSRPEFLRPHVIVVHRGGRPEAMLVGRLEQKAIEVKIGYLSLLKRKARSLTFIYGGVLGNLSSEGSDALVREILGSLQGGEAAVAYFSHLKADSPFYESITKLTRFLSRDHFPLLQVHRVMTLPGSLEQLHRRLSPEVWKNKRWKKLLRDYSGAVTVHSYCEPADLERVFTDVEEIAKKTYQRGLGVGFVDSPEMRDRLHLLAQKGQLRAFVLYIADKPCAFWMGTLYGSTFHSDCTQGYDPSYSKYSPGMLVMMKAIEGFYGPNGSDRVREIDFGLGDAPYKALLGNREWQDASLYMFAPTLRGVAMNVIRMPAIILDRFARRVLDWTKSLEQIKRAWRSRAIKKDEE